MTSFFGEIFPTSINLFGNTSANERFVSLERPRSIPRQAACDYSIPPGRVGLAAGRVSAMTLRRLQWSPEGGSVGAELGDHHRKGASSTLDRRGEAPTDWHQEHLPASIGNFVGHQ